MAEPVVVVALPRENRPEPVEERNPRIGVMAADAEHANVERDERVTERGETKPPIGREENDESDQTGRGFQPPRKAIMRSPRRPENDGDHGPEESEFGSGRSFH